MWRREEERRQEHRSAVENLSDKPMTLLVLLSEGGKDHMESDRSFFGKPERPIDWMCMILNQRRDRRKGEHVPVVIEVFSKHIKHLIS
jgi:hypothetical protein